MTKIQSFILKLLYLLLCVKCIFGYDTIFKSNLLDVEQIRNEMFLIKNYFNLSTAIIESMSNDWMENRDCFIELKAIENGIRNFDEWAIKSM